MANFNKVILVGNVTRDTELRETATGISVADNTLAVNEVRGADSIAHFVDLTFWGKTAEVAGEYVAKGKQILVEGRLQQDRWTDDDGNNRSKLKVVVDRFQFLGGPKDAVQDTEEVAVVVAVAETPAVTTEDDIPF